MQKKNDIWGIDMGGTKIELVVLDSQDFRKVKIRERVPTEGHLGYEHVISQILKLVESVENKIGAKAESIGIGTPGRIDPDSELLKNSNTTCLNGKPFLKDLKQRLGKEIKMENDANCFALSEAMYWRKNGFEQSHLIFGVIMGTGVGGGLVFKDQLLSGIHGIAGEWGHNYLDKTGGYCYCGKIGCVETVLSGPGLQRYYTSLSGTELNMKEIVQKYREGNDQYAVDTLERLFEFFGKGIAQLINILDPDVIVLGGGIGNVDELYTLGVERVKKYLFNPSLQTAFKKPAFGDSSGVFGAALLNSTNN